MIRVLFVDDELRLRRAWEKLFHARADMELVGTLPQADGLSEVVAATGPDIVVIDLTMPGLDPLVAIAQLAETHPQVKAAVYSGHSDADSLRGAFDAGAWGYIDKLTPPAEMFTTIQRIADGEVVFPPSIIGQQA